MALSNRDRVGRVLDILRDALGPYVLREYKMVYKKAFAQQIDDALTSGAFQLEREAFRSEDTLRAAIDLHGWLNLMSRRWNEVFRQTLGRSERSYVGELQDFRNDWAHQHAFTNDEAQRVADTAQRLLKAIGAPQPAAQVEEIYAELRRLNYEAERKKAKKDTGPLSKGEVTTKAGLRPWRQVLTPHPDVSSGKYLQATFVADLADVLDGKAEPEYQDPVEFYRRTYLTDGLLNLLAGGLRRLTAEGGDPIVQLKTAFGGGKTHSMLALYHMAGSGVRRLADFPGGERIREKLGEDIDLPEARRAVLVGTALSAPNGQVHKADGLTTHTLWGELAYQLAGLEGYERVRVADEQAVSPGGNVLLELLNDYGPCLIIIDEFVAYARNIYGKDGLPCGTFESLMTFVQELTEAVRRADDSMLLISIPESDVEKGGQSGHIAADHLEKVIGRLESVWAPVTATESFEIVRRRLFTDLDPAGYAARDAVVSEFSQMYQANPTDYPTEVRDNDYLNRMKAAYPIHPELFERLYQDWSTLEKFQRTRGVLRLMAAVIHELWSDGDQSLLIMPGMVPLEAPNVKSELTRYLPEKEGWSAIIDSDIDGSDSRPFHVDGEVPNLGKYKAARRVARTVFVGSAPSTGAQTVRGLDEVRIKLATVQPGEPSAVFGDALRRLTNRLMYLYNDSSRYWYDTRPTVNRMARDRAQGFSAEAVIDEITRRLRSVRRSGGFAAAHVAPPDTGDVSDEPRARIVILPPDYTHKRTTTTSPALNAVAAILESRGNSPRIYRNMLVFVAPDENDAKSLNQVVRDFLAWQSIHDEEEQLNLDAQQRRQVRNNLETNNSTVDLRIQTTYSWLIVPTQPDPLQDVEWETHRISGNESLYDRAWRKLEQSSQLIKVWAPLPLKMELDRVLWKDNPHINVNQLWEYLARYCYLPRLLDRAVLEDAIQAGVRDLDTPFGAAESFDENARRYTGLVFREVSNVRFSADTVLVKPGVAQSQKDEDERRRREEEERRRRERGEQVVGGNELGDTGPVGPTGGEDPPPPVPEVYRRYHGSVQLKSQRVSSQVDQIVDEILQHLTSLTDCDVQVSLEIQARRQDGFDQNTMRTVNENSKTLKFDNFGFERD